MSGYQDPYSSPAGTPAPRKQGMSTALIVILGLVGVGVLGLAVCCGGSAFMFSRSMKTSPEDVRALTREISDIEIGPPWQPLMAMDLSAVAMPLRIAIYWIGDDRPGNMAMLMDIDEDPEVLDHPETFEAQMRQQVDQQAKKNSNMEPLRIESSEKIPMQVNGRPTDITLNDAVGQMSGEPYYEVMALFMGNEHPAVLYLRVKQAEMSRDEVLNILRSLES